MELKKIYTERLSKLKSKLAAKTKRDNFFSILRLALFALLIVVAIFVFQWNPLGGIIFIYLSISGFYFIVKNHEGIRKEIDVLKSLIDLNNAELKGLDGDISFYENGDRYYNDAHPFSMDLDIFGNKSLFQKLNRCASISGENHLATLLTDHLKQEEILENQLANQELEPLIDWRQEFFAIGQSTKKDPKELERIISWAESADTFYTPRWVMVVIPIFCMALFLYLFNYVSMEFSWLAFLPTAYLTRKNHKKISALQLVLGRKTAFLKTSSALIAHIENKDFSSNILKELKTVFKTDKQAVSKSIRKLTFYMNQLDQRLNVFTVIFNLIFLWDLVWVNRIHHWKISHAPKLKSWFSALGDIEAFNSTSTFAFNNPDFAYPSLNNENKIIAEAIGHPLLSAKARIDNDFSTNTKQHIKVITGSNMGGKSTFLRTIGINAVLAYAGTRTCSKKLTLPYLKLYTSMRTKDDLSDNTSSFYAELKRLKIVLEAVKSEQNVYFMLDEILKGTNTKDRHKGAKALILQFLKNKGAGLISTHDLELGMLAKEHPDQIENLCFEVDTVGDQLIFDYKIKKGVSKSFNATQLMREMGIEV